MSKKRVLLVSVILPTEGGPTGFSRELMRADLGWKVIPFNVGRPPKKKKKDLGQGYKQLLDAGSRRAVWGAMITLFNLVRFPFVLFWERPHIVHINGLNHWPFWEYGIYVLISKICFRRVVYHYHDSFDLFYLPSGRLSKWLIRRILQMSDTLIVLSLKVKKIVLDFMEEGKVYFIPSSVKTSYFSERPESSEKLYGDREKINVLFVGGQYPFRKGISDILKAAPRIIECVPNIHFLFTGGHNVESMLPQIEQMRLSDYISFLGWIPKGDKARLYHSADMLILPSYDEGLPYVIIEALASGLPIVSTSVGGIPEAVEDGINGFIIEPGSEE